MAEDKTMNLSIIVDDGRQRVPIHNTNGDEIGVFYFSPTDLGIVERYNRLAEAFDTVTEPLDALQTDENGDLDLEDPAFVAALNEAQNRLYALVDELFGGNAAEAFFGSMNPFSPVDGNFYCANVLQAVGTFIGQRFDTETKKMSENVRKYTNRATRRAKKKE